MEHLPLEDNVSDIISKAQKGWPLDPEDQELAKMFTTLSQAEQQALADKLHLGGAALVALANNSYHPIVDGPSKGFRMFTTVYGKVTVNAFLIWNPATKEAAIFDTGGDCLPMAKEIETLGLVVETIFITHGHGDHVGELERLLEKLPVLSVPRPIYVAEADVAAVEALGVPGVKTFAPGVTFSTASFQVESRDVSGHSPGLVSYAVHGLDRPLSIVGDALFAGSVGGIRGDYSATLERIRGNILSDQANTVLAPGHGPLTSVGLELVSNPFFAKARVSISAV